MASACSSENDGSEKMNGANESCSLMFQRNFRKFARTFCEAGANAAAEPARQRTAAAIFMLVAP